MSARVISLLPQRPFKDPLDLVKIEAGLDGSVFLTVVDGSGDEIEVAFDPKRAKAFRDKWDAALETAAHVRRL